MKRILLAIMLLLGIVFGRTLSAVAECSVNGTPGNNGTSGADTITCDNVPSPTQEGVGGQGGSDTIIIEEGSNVSVVGGDAIGQAGGISTGVLGAADPPASDTIIVNGTANGIFGDFVADFSGADDTIIIGSTGNVNQVVGDNGSMPIYLPDVQLGSDTIVVDAGGVVNNNVSGDNLLGSSMGVGGNDNITINGTVGGDVGGYIGNDSITIGGTVNGIVSGGVGNDKVTLNNGANGGIDGTLLLDGDTGQDTLVFAFTVSSPDDYNALAALIAANAPSGSITINRQTISWSNFEELVNALIANFNLGTTLTFKDNRLNSSDAAASALAYCQTNGVQILRVDPVTASGSEAFTVSLEQVHAAIAEAAAQSGTVEVASGAGISLLASADGKLTVVAPDIADASKTYQFDFESTVCG